jgi:hypothetical protein
MRFGRVPPILLCGVLLVDSFLDLVWLMEELLRDFYCSVDRTIRDLMALHVEKPDGCRPFANLIGDLLSLFDPHAADSGNVDDGDFAWVRISRLNCLDRSV